MVLAGSNKKATSRRFGGSKLVATGQHKGGYPAKMRGGFSTLMRLFYFTRFGVKFNPILDNPIFNAIADIFLPYTKPRRKHKHKKEGGDE